MMPSQQISEAEALRRENEKLYLRLDKAALEKKALEAQNAELKNEAQAERDMKNGARGLLALIQSHLKVPFEPHQTFNERLLEAAENAGKSQAALEEAHVAAIVDGEKIAKLQAALESTHFHHKVAIPLCSKCMEALEKKDEA